jgi:2-dehydro-3-deoxyphosphogluconate aldolase/(4S)-4-hydroxy-2-oxoglutarate aldolase
MDTRGKITPLFLGVEHIAIYLTEEADAKAIADWYAETFGFTKKEGQTSIMVSGAGTGKIEVMKASEKGTRAHVAIYVSNFEAACNYLREKGMELEEPTVKSGVKAVYLKKTDRAGNRVHLIFRS